MAYVHGISQPYACRIRHTIVLDDPFDTPPELEALIPPASPEPQFGEVSVFTHRNQLLHTLPVSCFSALIPASWRCPGRRAVINGTHTCMPLSSARCKAKRY
eukprot:1148122-Pelagomonas_calceolata.AAC.2